MNFIHNNPMLLTDFYKICHKNMYPEGMTKLYSTWTPRSNKYFHLANKVVWFGLQGFIRTYLCEYFDKNFFKRDKEEVIKEFETIVHNCFDPDMTSDHIAKLHDLGSLPIRIMALPEGTLVPIGVPLMTIENTHPDFAWLTNYLETLISQNLWSPTTTATIAYQYHELLRKRLIMGGEDPSLAKSLFGDFSPRGMSSTESSATAGAGHLLSSIKTSAIDAIRYVINNYQADLSKETVGEWSASVEHSCVCSNYFNDGETEEKFFDRLLTEIYPNKPFTYVADSFDFWKFVTETLPKFKDKIMSRPDGAKVCIRPDSGDPVFMLCGDPDGKTDVEIKGLVAVMWDIFGGTTNQKRYKKLDSHIGIVYGDSITIGRCDEICTRLLMDNFCVSNVIFGVGSYTYNYNTRDTLGHALKATYCEVNEKKIQIFKDPKTDKDSMKKSQKGRVAVIWENDELKLIDQLDYESEIKIRNNMLKTVFCYGSIYNDDDLSTIRKRLHGENF